MPIIKEQSFVPPTHKQMVYMDILFNITGFTRNSRNAFLSAEVKRSIKYLDELKYFEASDIITRLKAIRESQKP